MHRRSIRVLVVDDSAFMRSMLKGALAQAAQIEVVGSACNGMEALTKIHSLKPDVITLDIEMPGLNGLAVLDEVMRTQPTPIVMVSTKTQRGAATTIDALGRGAVGFVAKPLSESTLEAFRADVVEAVTCAAACNRKLLAARTSITRAKSGVFPDAALERLPQNLNSADRIGPVPLDAVIAIGISAGGPQTLHQLIPLLPAHFPPILITLHMPSGFTAAFAERLNEVSALTVQEAQTGDELRPGVVYIAPGDQHMCVEQSTRQLRIALNSNEKVSGFRPSADVMFNSLAKVCPKRVVAIVMTGMGRDGAAGIQSLKAAGARTLAQDQATSIVYGMPKAAAETGCIDRIVSIEELPAVVASLLRKLPLERVTG